MASVKKKPVTKKSVAKKPVAKKAPAKKIVVKKTAVKAVVKKALLKKAPAKSVATKKAVTVKKTPKVAAPKAKAAKAVKGPDGLPEQIRDAVLKVLDERQAEEIVCITLTGRSSVADYLIIASGRAGRQIAAIADHLREAFFKLGVRQIRIEGQSEANWVLVDAGDVIVHLFRPEVRSYYDLDAIWADKTAK